MTDCLSVLGQAFEQRGWRVSVVTMRPRRDAPLPLQEVRASRLGSLVVRRSLGQAVFLVTALGWLVRHRRDLDVVVAVDTPPGIGAVARLVTRTTRRRVVVVSWVMDLFHLEPAGPGRRRPAQALRGGAERASLRGGRNLAIGRCMQRHLELGWGVGSRFLPLPVRVVDDATGVADTAGPLRVLYSGHASDRNPLTHVVRAMAALTGADVELLVSGEGPSITEAAALAASLGLESVTFTPRASAAAYAVRAAEADVHLVTLAADATGSCVPSKAYQAMARARPVLYVGDAGGQVALDVVEAGAGWVCEPVPERIADCLRRVAADRGAVREAGLRGLAFIRDHRTPDVVAAAWERELGRGAGDGGGGTQT